jgi:tripartite-type tricarboxylate transporter receptor subunit TctC
MYPAVHDALLELQPVSRIKPAIDHRQERCRRRTPEAVAWLRRTRASVGCNHRGRQRAHICLLYFQQKTGTGFQLVPYRGGAPVMQDLVAGQIDMFCAEASQTLSFLRSGKIKAFAVMSKERWPAAPDVPTMDEVGVPGMYVSFWNGLWALGTPTTSSRGQRAVVDAWGCGGAAALTDLAT